MRLPLLTPDQLQVITDPLQVQEIVKGRRDLNSGKAPTPDVFSAQFYKKFANLLAPKLLMVYNEALDIGYFPPPSVLEACIILLLKPLKDPTPCGSYRPLSMVNLDNKILAKLIANRLVPFMTMLIHPTNLALFPGGLPR